MSDSKGITINVSGGKSDIGNVVQGDRNQIESLRKGALAEFYSDLSQLRERGDATQQQVDELIETVKQLAEKKPDSDIVEKAKGLYKKFGWALDPLKKLLAILLP